MIGMQELKRETCERSYLNGIEEERENPCGVRRLGEGRKNGSEWWNDKIRKLIQKKREIYRCLLQNRPVVIKEENKEMQLTCEMGNVAAKNESI